MSLLPNEYRLALGDLTISLICIPTETVGYLANWFNVPSSNNEPDITLDFEIITHDDEPDLPNSLLIHKTVNSDGSFNISNGLLAGHYDPATRHGSLKAKFILLQGQLARILEQIFYQAFHSAKQTRPMQAFLIHSAAVIYKGEGYLFVGPSEAGKSTVARLSLEHVVLGDEMNLVVANESSMELIGTPFNGLFRDKQPGRAPLRAVFLLEQALKHNISEIGIAEAVTAMAAEIAPPVGLNEISVPETIPTMVDLASLFVGRTAIRRLSFLPDSGFWDCIDQKFGT